MAHVVPYMVSGRPKSFYELQISCWVKTTGQTQLMCEITCLVQCCSGTVVCGQWSTTLTVLLFSFVMLISTYSRVWHWIYYSACVLVVGCWALYIDIVILALPPAIVCKVNAIMLGGTPQWCVFTSRVSFRWAFAPSPPWMLCASPLYTL